MNIPKINFKHVNQKAFENAVNAAKEATLNTPSYRVPTYELKLGAYKANKNIFEKGIDAIKSNKKAARIGAVIVAGLSTIALVAKKVIDNKNQK